MVSYLFWCVSKAGTMNGTASLLNDHVYPIYIISSVTAICKEEILLFFVLCICQIVHIGIDYPEHNILSVPKHLGNLYERGMIAVITIESFIAVVSLVLTAFGLDYSVESNRSQK